MEWVDVLSQLISNVGFPIAACAFMGWMMYRMQEQITQIINANNTALNEMSESIKELIVKFDDHVDHMEQ